MKYLWFLYLKRFGYAFVDDADDVTPAPSSPLVTVQSPAGPSRPQKRTRSGEDPLPTPKRPKVGESRLKGSASGKGNVCIGTKGKSAAVFDNFPEDNSLFTSSQDSCVEPVEEDLIQGETTPKTKERLSGNDLYLARRAKRRQNVGFFSVKYTIGLLYLGLLYTHQKVLPSEMMR